MTKSALRTRDAVKSPRPAMFVMADRAGSILDHIHLVKIIVSLAYAGLACIRAFLPGQVIMAFLAFVVDGIEVNALVKPVA